MATELRESDWKILRQLVPIAVERYYDRVLEEARQILSNPEGQSAEERYGELAKLIDQRDRGLNHVFNDLRRSTGLICLLSIQSLALLTDEEYSRFSPEARARIASFLQIVNDREDED